MVALQVASVVPKLTTLLIVNFLYLFTTTQAILAYPYGCVPRDHVEEEVIKPRLEWNLESLV